MQTLHIFSGLPQKNFPVAKKYLELTDEAIRSVRASRVCAPVVTVQFVQHVGEDEELVVDSLHSVARLVLGQVGLDPSPSSCDILISLIHRLSAFSCVLVH